MTMTDVYRNVLDAPPISPPRFSLLSSISVVDEPAARWEGGYEFLSELGPEHHAEPLADCLNWYPNWLTGWSSHAVKVDPVALWAGDNCHTTMGTRSRDWQGLARRKLLAYQSYDLARWLWSDVLNPLVVAGNGNVDASPAAALAKLEDALNFALQGPNGVVHMQPSALTACAAAGAIRLDGTRYVTAMGTTVVADAGYAGYPVDAGAPGGSQAEDFWMVGTGPVRVRLGPIDVTEPGGIEAIDPSTNTVTVTAWRVAAVELEPLVWDPYTQGGVMAAAPYAVAYAITGASGIA